MRKIVHKLTENASLFRPKNALFLHIFAGGGTTFWQAQNGVFNSGVAPVAARAHFLCHVSRDTKRPSESFLDYNVYSNNKQSVEVFFERINDERVSITMRTTFGACRKDGVLFINLNTLFLFISSLCLNVPRSVNSRLSYHDEEILNGKRSTRYAQAFTAEIHVVTRRRAACRRRSEVDVPLRAIFRKNHVADIACLPAPEN